MNIETQETASVAERVANLRRVMARENIAACLIPSADPHLSEYLPGRWQGRQWLSGFTGSAGTLVVTKHFAGLWTDCRYWAQAARELDNTGILLMKIIGGHAPAPHVEWLAQNVPADGTVAVDGATLSLISARALADVLRAARINLRTDIDLLDHAWSSRPVVPENIIFEHVAPYAPRSRATKLDELRRAMCEKSVQWHFISTLDDIAWLFNLRGTDVAYNPVFVAHALIGADSATLFVQAGKVPAAIVRSLKSDGVRVAPYEGASLALAALPGNTALLADPRRVTLGLLKAVPPSVNLVEAINPTTLFKSRKTLAETDHLRATMEQDGAALAEFFAWFDGALGRERITELTVDERLTAARARRPDFVSPSFGTIVGFNANGAMPHYQATAAVHSIIENDGLLLIDSGGQYLGGTTDITRVIPVGTLTDAHRRDYTTVLKGTMALSRARFPRGIRSPMLDAIARAPLWESGMDYGHGTGHGVGYFLNVHEGPQVIAHQASAEPWTAMEEGMVTSIEPGIYRPGKWGVRIENLVLNRSSETTEFGDFLEFETLTLCPIDTRCVARDLLGDDERAWLNSYHEMVRARISPHLSGEAKTWLESRTQAI